MTDVVDLDGADKISARVYAAYSGFLSHQKLLRDFGIGKADVLIGTQMIAKGLQFPEVTLVSVLNSDTSLNIPDFRASETAFQLTTQVAGRSGRGYAQGEVIVQTSMPDNPTI